MRNDMDAMPGRVPLEDRVEGVAIYSPAIPPATALGAAVGALVVGLPAYLIETGRWAIPELGQFSASGDGVATFVGVGLGVAIGGLAGALAAVLRLPRRDPDARPH